MKKKEKQMILFIILVGVIIISILYMATRTKEVETSGGEEQVQNKVTEEFVQVLEDGSKINTSTKLNETKNVNGLEIGNIQLSMVNGETILLANVKNNTGVDIGVKAIDIVLYNKNGGEIVTINGVIGNVKAGESVQLEASTTLDFANAYDFKVVIK